MESATSRFLGAILAARGADLDLAEVCRAFDPVIAAGLLVALALGAGTILELGFSFEAPAHAAAVVELFAAR